MSPIDIPTDVQELVQDVFAKCNARITEKLSNNPNLPEESLDLTWIEHLSRYMVPRRLPSEWTVQFQTHYLGGLRHFRRWEIADIGVLLFIKRGGVVERKKVALLQSKRLYPTSNTVIEESWLDYEIGFARLADPEDLSRSIALEAEFEFTTSCQYGALQAGSDQVTAIAEYQQENELAVYYQFYNPWRVPFKKVVPLSAYAEEKGAPEVGTRVIPSDAVHAFLSTKLNGYRPTLNEISQLIDTRDGLGWTLQEFIGDLFLNCREGSVVDSWADGRMRNLFERRTGPIAAAISIVVEAPEGVEGGE
jgi:hypothetical protein